MRVCGYASLCSSDNKRRTRHVQNTSEPEWHQTLVFMNLTRQQLASQTLELTVWDYDRFKAHDFLGETSLNLSGTRWALYFSLLREPLSDVTRDVESMRLL